MISAALRFWTTAGERTSRSVSLPLSGIVHEISERTRRSVLRIVQFHRNVGTPLPRLLLLHALTAALAFSATPPPSKSTAPADVAAKRWAQYEPSFKAFAEEDRAQPPVKGGILFVGSSIFRRWTSVGEMMAPLPVLNRAFGGSRTGDQVARFDQVVPPYAPKIIVYYCGSNDLKAGDMPDAIFERFRKFSQRVRATLPATRLVFVSATRSPDRVDKWDRVDRYNQLVRDYCAATPGHAFVDVNPRLVDRDGQPRLDLYLADKLHFHPPAYVEFTAVIKPVLTRIWAEMK